ncbi:hypothetical protein Dfer_4189 [Dyadobacter fermentans DSM 18053]|uniref:Outer membrane protein beta-barrel domain-containing protein n=2 Tax=Dyadobacter fermentans TaxID=94254 RepID=C6W0T7_DYAFD|nr:hypothetical protein Dfer_4189 [Dyadobacter fermentans DSM 18053]
MSHLSIVISKMKKIFLFTVVSLLAFSAAHSQSSIVKFHPIPLINRTLSLGFEQKVSQSGSVQVNVDYATETDFGFKSTWFGIGAEYRIYNLVRALKGIDENAPNGFFVAPTVGIRFFKDIDKDDPDPEFDEKYSFAHVGALAGYQWLPNLNGKKPLAIEGSVGLLGGLMTKGEKIDYEDWALWPRFGIGFVPAINMSVGFAFGK